MRWQSICEDGKKVEAFKKANPNAKRSKITDYISKTLHSRQESVPLIGTFIDKALVDCLHLMNNCCEQAFRQLLYFLTNITCDFKALLVEVESASCIENLPSGLKEIFNVLTVIRAGRLHNSLKRHVVNEHNGDISKWNFRFNGEESQKVLNNYTKLIDV